VELHDAKGNHQTFGTPPTYTAVFAIISRPKLPFVPNTHPNFGFAQLEYLKSINLLTGVAEYGLAQMLPSLDEVEVSHLQLKSSLVLSPPANTVYIRPAYISTFNKWGSWIRIPVDYDTSGATMTYTEANWT